jgi:RND family efflux transporter MFP subunit
MVKRLLVIFLISLIFLSGCSKKVDSIPTLKAPVKGKMETAVVSRGDIFELTTYDAKVYPDLQVIYPTMDGSMKELKVNLGQDVKKGDILAYLDSTELSDNLKQLEETMEDAKTNNKYNNSQQELDMQILELNIRQKIDSKAPEIEIAQMQADLEKLELTKQQTLKKQEYDIKKLQMSIDEAKAVLENTVIKAPSSGQVVYINTFETGAKLSMDNPVIIITDESKLHIQSEYLEQNIFIDASQVYAAINGKEYEIEYIPLESDQIVKMKDNGAAIESRYSIVGNMDGITSGDYACIGVKNKVRENVINIPKNALYSDAEGNFVYRMTDGVFTRCNIETGMETDIQIEIISGLEEGDVIYVQGS